MKKNKLFPNNNRGTLLMHTVVLSVVMSMMGTMMLKWATSRYETVAQSRRQMKASMLAQSCLAQKMAGWVDNAPMGTSASLNCSLVMDGTTVSLDVQPSDRASLGYDPSYGLVISVDQSLL